MMIMSTFIYDDVDDDEDDDDDDDDDDCSGNVVLYDATAKKASIKISNTSAPGSGQDNSDYQVHTAHCTQHTGHCTLHTAHCTPAARG